MWGIIRIPPPFPPGRRLFIPPSFAHTHGQALAVRINVSIVFLDLFLGVSLLAAPHYRPAAVAIQTALHLTRAVFGPADARPWHLLVLASGVLFLPPGWIQERLRRAQVWLQPGVSYESGRGRGRAGWRGGRGRGRGRGGRTTTSPTSVGVAGDTVGLVGGRGEPRNGVVDDVPGVMATSTPPQGATKSNKDHIGKLLPLQPKPSSATAALVSMFILAQVFVPLRHLLVTEFPVEWSREGHEFSWRGGGGSGGRGGGGGLVREDALVRVIHRAKGGGGAGRGNAGAGVQSVHLYGAPLTAQQVI